MPKKLPKVSKKGFHLQGDRENILLLHGFTGTPYDLKPLGLFLHEQKFNVTAPLLFGHGQDQHALIRTPPGQWLKETRDIFEAMPFGSIIIGLSMGALLAIILAFEGKKKPKALVLLSPSLYLDLLGESLSLGLAMGLIPQDLVIKKFSGHSDILDPIARKQCPSLPYMPLLSLNEFNKLRKKAIKYLPKIDCPMFVAFGQKDNAINIYDSKLLFFESKNSVAIKEYPNSKHVITLDYDRDELNSDILAFLVKIIGDKK